MCEVQAFLHGGAGLQIAHTPGPLHGPCRIVLHELLLMPACASVPLAAPPSVQAPESANPVGPTLPPTLHISVGMPGTGALGR